MRSDSVRSSSDCFGDYGRGICCRDCVIQHSCYRAWAEDEIAPPNKMRLDKKLWGHLDEEERKVVWF